MVLANWRIWNWRLTDHTWFGTLEHTKNVFFDKLLHGRSIGNGIEIEWDGYYDDGWKHGSTMNEDLRNEYLLSP
jgi:hypothetical protein